MRRVDGFMPNEKVHSMIMTMLGFAVAETDYKQMYFEIWGEPPPKPNGRMVMRVPIPLANTHERPKNDHRPTQPPRPFRRARHAAPLHPFRAFRG